MTGRESTYRADIDGIRALAVALVVANHAWARPSGGYVGVDVFFVISGYLITRGLVREQAANGGVGLARFFLRRAARLLPAAVLVIVVTAAACALLYFPVTSVPLLLQGAASLLSVENWALVRAGSSYLDPSGGVSPFQHFWSLSVEEQFYVCWPWLLVGAWWIGRRRPRKWAPHAVVLGVALAAVALSLLASVLMTEAAPNAAYFLPFTRAWEFGVGALVVGAGALDVGRARLPAAPAVVRPLLRPLLRGIGAVAIVGSAMLLGPATPYPGLAAVLPVAGAAALILAGDRTPGWDPVGRILTAPVVRYVGRLSYALYLWHAPVLLLAAAVCGTSPWVVLLSVIASAALAMLTHHLVENPARRAMVWRRAADAATARRRWTRTLGFACTVGLLGTLSLAQWHGPAPTADAMGPRPRTTAAPSAFPSASGLAAALRLGAESTSWGTTSQALSALTLPRAEQMDCLRHPSDVMTESRTVATTAVEAAAASVTECSTGHADGPRALVLGDSIAMSWMPGVIGALAPDGWQVSGLGLESCPAAGVSVAERRGRPAFPAACREARRSDVAAALALRPDLVILSSAEGSLHRLTSGSRGKNAGTEWQQGLRTVLADLGTLGIPIVVLGNPPEGVSPTACATRLNGPASCLSTPSAEWRTKAAAERAAVREARASGLRATYVEVEAWFCDDRERCPLVADGELIRVDIGHLTQGYAQRLATVLRSSLPPEVLALGRSAR